MKKLSLNIVLLHKILPFYLSLSKDTVTLIDSENNDIKKGKELEIFALFLA